MQCSSTFLCSTLPYMSFGHRHDGHSGRLSSKFPPASWWAWDAPISFSTACRRPLSCHQTSHLLLFTEWVHALFSIFFPFLLSFSPPFPPFVHPVSSQTNHPVILVLLHPFPNLVFLLPLHTQSQHYMTLMIWFPRYRCPCKAPFPNKKSLLSPLKLPGSYWFQFAYLTCFLRYAILLVHWFFCAAQDKFKHCLSSYTTQSRVKAHPVTCFSQSFFVLTAHSALPLLSVTNLWPGHVLETPSHLLQRHHLHTILWSSATRCLTAMLSRCQREM